MISVVPDSTQFIRPYRVHAANYPSKMCDLTCCIASVDSPSFPSENCKLVKPYCFRRIPLFLARIIFIGAASTKCIYFYHKSVLTVHLESVWGLCKPLVYRELVLRFNWASDSLCSLQKGFPLKYIRNN